MFFGLSSVFGGLLSAAVVGSWPEPVYIVRERLAGNSGAKFNARSSAVELSLLYEKGLDARFAFAGAFIQMSSPELVRDFSTKGGGGLARQVRSLAKRSFGHARKFA